MEPDTRPRVLDVGQCTPDHANIARLLKQEFDAVVDRAKTTEQVTYMTGFYDYDLVLVNRILDADGSAGLTLIELMKSSDELRTVPVMLVSNFADAQAQAVQAGAIRGFGKDALGDPATIDLLAIHLKPQPT